MAVIKPESLTHQQTVLQYRDRYFAIISADMAFTLNNSKVVFSEQHFNNELTQIQADLQIDNLVLNEGYAKQNAEVMLIARETAQPWHFKMEGIEIGSVQSAGIKARRSKAAKTSSPIVPVSLRARGPIGANDPRRWQYFKDSLTYWKKQGLPTLPDEFDFQFFQQALSDQQRQGYFKAGEAWQLNWQGHNYTGTLPVLHARLLLADRKFEKKADTSKNLDLYSKTHPFDVDTFYILPEQNMGIIIFRSCFEVSQVNMKEWEHTFICLENPAEPENLANLSTTLRAYLKQGAVLRPDNIGLVPGQNESAITTILANTSRKVAKMKKWADKISLAEFVETGEKERNIGTLGMLRHQPDAESDAPNALMASRFYEVDFYSFNGAYQSLEKLSFEDCSFAKIDFGHAALTDILFINCRFNEINFSEAELRHVNFIQCQFEGGSWADARLSQCKIVNSQIDQTQWHGLKINESTIADTTLINIDAEHSRWERIQISGGGWQNIKFGYAEFKSVQAQDLKILDVDLQYTMAENIMLNGEKMMVSRVNLSHADWQGVNLIQSCWHRVICYKTILSRLEWSAAKIIRSRFEESRILKSTWVDTLFLKAVFLKTDLNETLLQGAVFKYSDIQDCSLTPNDMKHVNLKKTICVLK